MFDWLSEPITWGGFIVYVLIMQSIINFIRRIVKSGK